MPTSRDYLIPRSYGDDQLLALLKTLDGDFRFSQAERSQILKHLMLLIGVPALWVFMYLNGRIAFPPADYYDWVWSAMVVGAAAGSAALRMRRLDNLRFRDGMLYFIDKAGVVTRSVSVPDIARVIILSREKVGRVRLQTADKTIDFVVPDELLAAIQRDADDPFDVTRF